MFNPTLKMRDYFILFNYGNYWANMYWSRYWAKYWTILFNSF